MLSGIGQSSNHDQLNYSCIEIVLPVCVCVRMFCLYSLNISQDEEKEKIN